MEDEHTSLVPLSPSSSALFASFTTLYDDNPLSAVDLDASALELDAGNYTNLVNLADGSESQQIGESQSNSPPPPNAEHYYTTKPSQRMTRTAAFKEQKFPCYMCFSLVTGEPTKPPKRSALSLEGREQAKRVRRMGACLRCQLRKIKECSGENPCKECVGVAQARANSRALEWMECVRTSFNDVSIFQRNDLNLQRLPTRAIMAHLLGDIDGPEEALPSFMNLDRTTKWLADWLMDGTNHLNFSLGCFLRSGKLSNMLGSTLGADIKDHFRIMIYLTNNVLHRSPGASFRGYSSEELEEMRNQMGSEVLRVISAKLKPAHLEASKAKLQDLQALFLIILGLSITARYSFLDAMLNGIDVSNEKKQKTEAFICLLSHYQIFIGKVIGLFKPSCEQYLMKRSFFRWDKTGCCTSLNSSASGANVIPGHPTEPSTRPLTLLHSAPGRTSVASLDTYSLKLGCERIGPGFVPELQESDQLMLEDLWQEAPNSTQNPLNSSPIVTNPYYTANTEQSTPACGTYFSREGPCQVVSDASLLPPPELQEHNLGSNEPPDSITSLDRECPYWTFYNQHEPFRIHSSHTNISYTITPVPSSERIESGPVRNCGACREGFYRSGNLKRHSVTYKRRR